MGDLGDRVVRTPDRAEPVRARLEIRLENWLEHRLQASLDHAVGDGGYTEFAEFPAFLRYKYPTHLHRPELTRLQRVPELAQESSDPDHGLDPGRGDLIDSRGICALIGGHALPRIHQERRVVDEVEQVAETAGRIFSRPAMQFVLHTPYRDASLIRIGPAYGAGIRQRTFGHYFPSLDRHAAALPQVRGSPALGVLRRLRPTRAFSRRHAYPDPVSWTDTGPERTRMVIAVGTALAGGPPRRSQRAELPHWAPASGTNAKAHVREGMRHAGGRQPPISQAVNALPVQAGALAAAPQRLVPVPCHLGAERRHRLAVAGHGVVGAVPSHHAA